ncbi:hypothetical protein O1L55_22740 [Streptomyces albulus]|nr:hypothetical protein [Streptomyces noursei]
MTPSEAPAHGPRSPSEPEHPGEELQQRRQALRARGAPAALAVPGLATSTNRTTNDTVGSANPTTAGPSADAVPGLRTGG